MSETKIILSEKEMPDKWYNVVSDLPAPPAPPLDPGTHKPIGPEALAPIFPMELIKQEVSRDKWVDIPDELMDIYKIWRPTPLHRAVRLEKELRTPARIYFKNESVSPPGSHKPNTAIAQAYYNKKEGVARIATETGAGQWGSALSLACNIFGIKCTVYMVKVSYQQKPYRKHLMHVWGADVYPSPTDRTNAGRQILKADPDTLGSLGMAISEAVEDAATHEDTKYSLGSVLNHVLLHQTIVGQEVQKQFKMVEDYPDVIVGCVGGGSNFAGLAFPFIPEKLKGKNIHIIAVEPTACPTLTKGPFRYDFGDTAKMTPLLKMFTLGHSFVPPGIHAGGLRYHGMAPLVSHIVDKGIAEARAYPQTACFEAALMFAKTEGIVPAPETSHALRAGIDEAIKCRETKQQKCILIGFSGHGHFDLAAYDNYLSGHLKDYEYPVSRIDEALAELPEICQ